MNKLKYANHGKSMLELKLKNQQAKYWMCIHVKKKMAGSSNHKYKLGANR